jgi:hypothetical protein
MKTGLCAAAAALILIGLQTALAAADTTGASGLRAPCPGSFQEAAIVCGGNGCAPAQTAITKRRRFIPLGHG